MKYALYLVLERFDVMRVNTSQYLNIRGAEPGSSVAPPPEIIAAAIGQGLSDNRHVVCFHLTQATRVYNVEDDVACIICEALSSGAWRKPWPRWTSTT